MCIVIFSIAACSCPPVPTYPYIRLCPTAKSHNPIQACPQGHRLSETFRFQGECQWCRQCAREKAREERREWVKSRLGVQGRESIRREGMREVVGRAREGRDGCGYGYGLGYGFGGTGRAAYSAW